MTVDMLLIGPVAVNLVGIFALWLYYSRRNVWPARPLQRGKIFRCGGCGIVYVDGRDLPMARCPRCSVFNEAIRR